jgi:hypothetical protein
MVSKGLGILSYGSLSASLKTGNSKRPALLTLNWQQKAAGLNSMGTLQAGVYINRAYYFSVVHK